MKKRLYALAFATIATHSLWAQADKFSLSAVSEAIKAKASIIKHLEDIDVKIEGPEKCVLKVHKIYTVMNAEGKSGLYFGEYSSKAISLNEVELKVYDANGKQIEKRKKKDMVTMAVGEGLIDDGYMTYYRVGTNNYPVTVDLSFEQTFKSTINLPPYRFIDDEEGVVESNYTVHVPADLGFRYKSVNTDLKPETTEASGVKNYKWTVRNLAPLEDEEGGAAPRDRFPHIAVAVDQFTHFGFKGNLSSWKEFGAWISELYKGLDELPEERQQFFKQLVSDAPNEREKVKRIYDYLQKNFRYVSIQLGIGGLRPFSATFTDQKKYGDCKALSNFMKAALKSVGIKSHVAIINAEYNATPVDPAFPANNFNHVILCVPGAKDSIWLECTSSTAEFAVLGTFTENRNALLITDEGGVLVSTPKSAAAANVLSTVTTVSVLDDLSASTETVFSTKGEYREIMDAIAKENRNDQKEALVFYFGFKQPDDFVLAKEADKSKLKMALRTVSNFNAGNKLFIDPRLYKLWSRKLPKSESRKQDFYFKFPFEKHDTTIYKFPASVKPETLPTGKEFSCDYANYKSNYWYNEAENAVYASTTLVLKQHKIPAASYAAVKSFFDNLAQDDAQKFVMKKTVTAEKAEEKKAF